ncbi:MAG: histidinol-phosphate transaminase [Spartobacteria bacterium]|nr:histidinol-phosphate transaminase [Spartobacteria bacterium]
MTSHYIRKNVQDMQGYVPGEQPRSRSVIKLNTNENPYPPSSHIDAALKSIDLQLLARYPDPVCSELRQILADVYHVSANQVFCGNGSDEVLALTIRSFVEEQGSIGYFDPSYSLYPVLADIAGVKKHPLPLTPDFDWDFPEKCSDDLFFFTNPNAPTSVQCTPDRVRAFCRSCSGVVLIDEAYVDFAPAHCMALVNEFDHVLVARTLSKSYSLANIRMGILVGPEPLIDAMYKIKDSYNINGLTQRVAAAALRDQSHMTANVRRILSTRTRVTDALQKKGWTVMPSATNFLWARPPVSAAELYNLLRKNDIFVRYFPGEKTGDWLRISMGTDAQMDQLLQIISTAEGASHD